MPNVNLLRFTPSTLPIGRVFPVKNQTLHIIKTMENPNENPVLSAIQKFADNPEGLQNELKKLLKGGKENFCDHLLDILAQRDKVTVKHSHGVSRIITKFSNYLELPARKTKELKIAALVHDIGKLFTPLSILNKPGKLNNGERRIMSQHAPLGRKFLEQLGVSNICKTFKKASLLAENHHKPIDSLSLSKTRKLEEEILEMSDVFSALTTHRPYKTYSLVKKSDKKISQTPAVALKLMEEKQEKEKLWNSETFNKFKEFVQKTYCKK